jgi:hypothetical protein
MAMGPNTIKGDHRNRAEAQGRGSLRAHESPL